MELEPITIGSLDMLTIVSIEMSGSSLNRKNVHSVEYKSETENLFLHSLMSLMKYMPRDQWLRTVLKIKILYWYEMTYEKAQNIEYIYDSQF